MSKIIIFTLISLIVFVLLPVHWIYDKLADKDMEIETLTYYLEKADGILNTYKPQLGEYVGNQYNNTNSGEVITIYDIRYENGILWLLGKTPLGKTTNAPSYHYAVWDNSPVHATTVFDLLGWYKKGGAMYDTLTDKQKKMVTNE